ncbi:hypothetical protein TTHERM_00129310 (macronuclear) [Tetrahymena thermophila SB210]|uniref:Uncharacterized protein n=1 Tax=Tetrahymena thermophila (strain SB210) TaxID=312017 RepID=I7LUW1_TETTS|nr:hypothetical protein TTHERM_00129310 [Tetrahymena thermophila SB210]EAR96155.1 hypothetical protein TTHERM_00129310 [Tetrahymena thermophila SB210]|eukprot:XP_001016400.1 hypothetical protein TTHERM_00129310 [Tetrahymena thermophila SB210]
MRQILNQIGIVIATFIDEISFQQTKNYRQKFTHFQMESELVILKFKKQFLQKKNLMINNFANKFK